MSGKLPSNIFRMWQRSYEEDQQTKEGEEKVLAYRPFNYEFKEAAWFREYFDLREDKRFTLYTLAPNDAVDETGGSWEVGGTVEKAPLGGANLRGANLTGTNLTNAYLSGNAGIGGQVKLWEANLSDANLSEADLSEADFDGANLSRADLSKADLSGADLSRATNLTQEQVDQAHGNEQTKLPDHLKQPAGWSRS